MAVFDDKHVDAAIARLPRTATTEIRELRRRAEARGIASLVEACDRELAARPVDLSAEAAVKHAQMAEAVKDLDFIETVAAAFSKVLPPNVEEQRFLRWVRDHPGATYKEAEAVHGKGDLGLVIGHLVYERFGCFRRYVAGSKHLSSVLLIKEHSGSSVRYTLREDAREGLRRAGVL